MKITKKWLNDHIDIQNNSIEDICNTLNKIGLEVEKVINNKEKYKDFIIGNIISSEKHPSADKLRICMVNDGKQILQIVCGADNARVGINVVLAPVGSIIPNGGMMIKQSQIRGVDSNGMLCSAEELEINTQISVDDGIIEIPNDAKIGSNFAEYEGLDDVILDISITPNRRIDCASVKGIARELFSAGLGVLKKNTETSINAEKKTLAKIDIKTHTVVIEDIENCHEFYLQYINNIDINKIYDREEYKKITSLLKAIDESHKHILVNISNYIMFDTGRPNHFYDADKINGKVYVRQSVDKEKFIPLNSQEIILPSGILVIADDEKILSIAGIIGGELSKVDDNTKNIAIEIANFSDAAVIKSGRILNIHTQSRFRFEGRIDAADTNCIINNMSNIVIKLCGGEIGFLSKIYGNKVKYTTEVDFDFNILNTFANYDILQDKAINILEKLGFSIENLDKNKCLIKIPTWRQGDVIGCADIVEEIVRINGFEYLKDISINMPLNSKLYGDLCKNTAQKYITNTLLSRGMIEVISWSFISGELISLFKLDVSNDKNNDKNNDENNGDLIKLDNPISDDLKIMRPTIIPSLWNILEKNVARGIADVCIFENANIYSAKYIGSNTKNDVGSENTKNQYQQNCIAGMRSGYNSSHNIHKDIRKWDFYDIRDDVLLALVNFGLNVSKINITGINTEAINKTVANIPKYYHPGKSAALMLGNVILGFCGELHPSIIKSNKLLLSGVCAFEILCDNLPKLKVKIAKSPIKLSQYQEVERDLAFFMDFGIKAGDVCIAIKNLNNNLIKDIKIFDVYYDKKILQNKQSIAIRLIIQSEESTLKDNQINIVVEQVVSLIERQFDANLRK